MVVQVKAEPSQPEWTKVCGKDQNTNSEICYTTRDFVSDQGQPVLALAVYDVKGPQPQRVVRFVMPLGLLLQPGLRFAVDQAQPISGRYVMCLPNGCFAEAQVKDDFIPKNFPAWSAVGVTQLAYPELVVEIRAVAVVGSGAAR